MTTDEHVTDLPYFPFFAKDWLASSSVRRLTLAEKGAYLELLAFSWINDGLQDGAKGLAQLLNVRTRDFARLWPALEPFFPLAEDGRRRNPRQERERNSCESVTWRDRPAVAAEAWPGTAS